MKQNSSKGENSRKTVYYVGSGLAIGAAIGMIFGLMLFENLAWGCVIGAAVGLVIGAAIDAHEGDKVMESRKRPLLGLVLISGSYCLGVAALIVAMFFNREQVGVQIANVHGVPALAGFPILILTCIVGALVAIGLYKMTSWGYWLTLIYVCYLLVVPPILVGKVPSLIGNITWPLTVAVYLVLRRKQYFGTDQSA